MSLQCRASPSFDFKTAIVRPAPIPIGGSIVCRSRIGPNAEQGRIHLSADQRAAFAASFQPRVVADIPRSPTRGDFVSVKLASRRVERNSACVDARDFARLGEWADFPPYTPIRPDHFVTPRGAWVGLPQLGGGPKI